MNKKNLKKNFKIYWLIVLLLFLTYLLSGILYLNLNSDPQKYDTTCYLGEANVLKNNGGIVNFLNLCITGKYKQANAHPLYILLITPFASTDISFFINAKLISFIIGLVLIGFLFFISKKQYGDLIATISIIGLILNGIFIEWTTMVAPESTLMLFSTICIYFIVEGFKKNYYWIYAGVFGGLAYLTKGYGMFLVPGFILASLVIYRSAILKNRFFYLFFISFLLTVSPLFIRNIVLYQDPLFNVNKYIAMYSFEDIFNSKYTVFNPLEGSGLWEFEKRESDKSVNNLSTNSIENKKSPGFFEKISSGLMVQVKVFFYSFIIYQKQFSGHLISLMKDGSLGKIFWLFSLTLFLLFIIGLYHEENLGAKIYIFSTLIVFIIALTLFRPITRYFLPIIPFLWIYIGLGMCKLIIKVNEKFFLKKIKINIIPFIPYILAFFLTLNISYTILKNNLSNPLESVKYSENRKDLLSWLKANLKKGDTYTMGPNFNWQLDDGIWVLPPMSGRENISDLISFVKRQGIRYVIMERNYIASFRDIAIKKLTGDYFALDPIEGIISKNPVEGWKLVYSDQKRPVEFLVYATL